MALDIYHRNTSIAASAVITGADPQARSLVWSEFGGGAPVITKKTTPYAGTKFLKFLKSTTTDTYVIL